MDRVRGGNIWVWVLAVGLAAVLAIGLSPGLVEAQLPPRPTRVPTATPPSVSQPGPVGAWIELRVDLGLAGLAGDWPAAWTVVQWEDLQGGWHDVEGWRGGLDGVEGGLGYKTWWLSANHFGSGPFRWLVYRRPGGGLVAESEPFDLPGSSGETLFVEVGGVQGTSPQPAPG